MKLTSHFYVTFANIETGLRVLKNVEGYTVTGHQPYRDLTPIGTVVAIPFDSENGSTVISPEEFCRIVEDFFVSAGRFFPLLNVQCTLPWTGALRLGTSNAWMGETMFEANRVPIQDHSVMKTEVAGGLHGNAIGTWTYTYYLTGPNHLISPWHYGQLLEGHSTWHTVRSTFVERETGKVLYDNFMKTPFDFYSGIAAHSSTGNVSQVPRVGVVTA